MKINDEALENINGGRALFSSENDAVRKYEKSILRAKNHHEISKEEYMSRMENLQNYKNYMKNFRFSFEPLLFDENVDWKNRKM